MASIVDYLNAKGYDSSFGSRKLLWEQWRPGESYSGTAEQNLSLLAALQLDDETPQLQLTGALYPIDSDVTAKLVSGSEALVENGLGQQSLTVQPGDAFSLGPAPGIGGYPIRVMNGVSVRDCILFLLPSGIDGKLSATLLTSPTKHENAPSQENYQAPEKQSAVTKYLEILKAHPDLLKSAMEDVITSVWVAENIVSLTTTTLICGIGAWPPCLVAIGGSLVSVTADILKRAAEKMVSLPDDERLTDDEAKTVKVLLDVSSLALQVGLPLGMGWKNIELCDIAGGGLTGLDSVAGSVEKKNGQDVAFVVTARVFLQGAGKLTAVVCLKKQ